MKLAALSITILFFSLLTYGQSNSFNDSLYITALEKYSIELDSFYSKFGPKIAENSNIFLEHTYLIQKIPDSVLNRPIIVLTGKNYKKIFRQHKGHLSAVKIFPMETKGDLIEITVRPSGSELKRGKLTQVMSSWTNVYFNYDIQSKSWKYQYTENGGI